LPCVLLPGESDEEHAAPDLRDPEFGCFENELLNRVSVLERGKDVLLNVAFELLVSDGRDVFGHECTRANRENAADELRPHVALVEVSLLTAGYGKWLARWPTMDDISIGAKLAPTRVRHVPDIARRATSDIPIWTRLDQRGRRVLENLETRDVVIASPFEAEVKPAATAEQRKRPQPLGRPCWHQIIGVQPGHVHFVNRCWSVTTLCRLLR
jgi:hypothetical protein